MRRLSISTYSNNPAGFDPVCVKAPEVAIMVNMKGRVGIAELEANLSEYVRAAQGGEEIVIHDGDTPLAKLVPLAEREWPFRMIPASRPSRGSEDMGGVYPTGLTPEEVEQLIAETRADPIDEWLNEWLSSRESTSTPR
jgi:prevent-host-death family protein